jgi:hypothetical protein
MTIRKGEAWGAPGPSTGEVRTADNDRELALLAHERWRHHEHLTASVATGDLLATVGLDKPRPAGQRWRFPVDLALLHAGDGTGADQEVPFVAHLVARRGLWRGEWAVVMNAPLLSTRWLGPLRLGPRAHPNDGVLDITVGALDWRQRVEAARRARTGSHLPHPDLRTVRVSDWHHGFDRPIPVRVDGHPIGSYRTIAVSVIPDALELIV